MTVKPLKTTVVNLYGGPACGKSAASAYLFYLAKRNHIKCELVREYAKHYAWEGWNISHIDQFMIAGQQMKWEGMLWNKVRFIITDSPVILAAFYCKKHAGDAISRGLEAQINSYYELGRRNEVEFIHVNLNRVFDKYDPDGRYQDEETAKQYDKEIKDYVTDFFGVKMIESSAKPEDLKDLAGHLGWVNTLYYYLVNKGWAEDISKDTAKVCEKSSEHTEAVFERAAAIGLGAPDDDHIDQLSGDIKSYYEEK